jgi:putative transposase
MAKLASWENSLRFLWNIANEQRLMGLARTDKRYPSAFDQQRELTDLRRELPWLNDVPRSACAVLLGRLDEAWQRCFKMLSRQPLWKCKGESISLTESHSKMWRMVDANVWFPKLGTIRTVLHRPLEGQPKTCTLKRDGDQWFAVIVCEIERDEPIRRAAPVVALDRGVTNLLADSDGNLTPNPRHYERAMKRLAHAQRVVSRREKGSKNREKAKLRLMRLHRKVRRQREHYLHVLSSRYSKSHGVVVIEKLNVKGMIRSRLARHIADAGWSSFANMLRYKLAWSGGTLIEVPAAYSSQECSACGCIDAKSRKGEAFCCTGCGYVDHADLNAAKNLKARASRSGMPGDGTLLEGAGRTRKAKVKLRASRRKPLQSVAT